MKKLKTKYTLRKDGRIMMRQTINGKRVSFYGSSDRECEDKRDAYIAELNSKPEPFIPFKTVSDTWWDKREKTISPNTVGGYKTAMQRCDEEFGKQPIDKITMQQIIVFLQSFAIKGYSQKVISNTKCVLHQIFDEALLQGLILANPCTGMPVIKGAPKKPRQAAPETDIEKIEASKTESLAARMSYFMLYTGARRGEAAALQQKNINREKHVAYIVQSVAYGSSSRKPILKKPKTEAGVRTIELPDNVLEILPLYEDDETYIFFPAGLPTKTELETGLRNYQADHGLQSTAHQLRHSYASILYSAGIDVKSAQYLLGHSTIAMTQDVYTHLSEAKKTDVRDQLNNFIKAKK
mgnify:CR=1 FL=1